MLHSKTLANITEIFQNIYHVHLHFTYQHREFFFWTPYICLAFQQKHIHQDTFKHLRWHVFACPVNDFKLLTVCTERHRLRWFKKF